MLGPFLIFCFAGCWFGLYWFLQRERPQDARALAEFAAQRGLRVTSYAKSSDIFHPFVRGFAVSSTARVYDLTVEDPAGNRRELLLAFDAIFGDPQPILLGGADEVGPSGDGATRSGWKSSWTWVVLLVSLIIGAGAAGFFFSGILYTDLSAPARPAIPQPALGFTHLFAAKHGDVYGTYFEYLVVTYGIWASCGVGLVGGLFGIALNLESRSRTYGRTILLGAAISLALYFAVWQLLFAGERP
jgi:hypothetical protein